MVLGAVYCVWCVTVMIAVFVVVCVLVWVLGQFCVLSLVQACHCYLSQFQPATTTALILTVQF